MWIAIGQVTLFMTRGTSDKFYQLNIEHDVGNLSNPRPFRVTFGYARRGSSANIRPGGDYSTLDTAINMGESILETKYRKGYTNDVGGRTYLHHLHSEFVHECQRAVEVLSSSRRTPLHAEETLASDRVGRMLAEPAVKCRTTRHQKEEVERLRLIALNDPDYDNFQARVMDLGEV
jgi:hypothetical protein